MNAMCLCPTCGGTGEVPRLTSNAKKEFCPKGHPYDAVNTYIRPNGWRECRKCRELRKERSRGGMAVTVRSWVPGGTR